LKKRLLSVVCIALITSFIAVQALAAEAGFSDVPADHTFYSGIMDCAGKGITSGYDDGTFRPANPVTRAQFCVMLSRAFCSDQIQEYNTDLYKTNWFGPNAKALSVNGVLKNTSMEYGFGEASIMNQNISRYDMAQLMTNIMSNNGSAASDNQKTSVQNKITDYGSIPAKYQNAVKNVYALGIITGYADGSFNGNANMNRGQGCIVIYRMLQFVPGNMGNNTGNTDNPVTIPDTPETEQPTTQTTGTLRNGQPITEENVLAILAELKAKYPEHTDFANGYTKAMRDSVGGGPSIDVNAVTNNYNRAEGGKTGTHAGCGGWAAFVSDYIFGQTGHPARKVDPSNARPGDIGIECDDKGLLHHVYIVTSNATYDDTTNFWKWSGTDGSTETGNNTDHYYIWWENFGHGTWATTKPGQWYEEIWTRYPTDNKSTALVREIPTTSETTKVPTQSTPVSSEPTPSESISLTATTAATHAHSDMLCAVCGTVIWNAGANGPNSNMSGWDDTRDIGVCNNCWLTPEGQKAFYGR